MTQLDLNAILKRLGPRFAAGVDERDQNDAFVADHVDELKREKIYSALVPQDIGGGGVRHSQMCAFLRALAHYCPSTALSLSMHQHLVAAAVFNHRNGKPGLKLLEKVAASEAVLVSTGANDWMESNGSARQVAGGYRVSARKPFASGSPSGDMLITSVAFDDAADGPQVLHFPVPMKSAGVSILDEWRAMGMRSSGSQTVVLDDVFVPEEAIALKRPRGRFHPAWNVILTVAMPLIMSVYVGVAESASREGRRLAMKRRLDETTPYLIGDMENMLTTAQLAVEDMVRLTNDFGFEPGLELTSRMLARKTITARHALAAAEKALEAAGGAGFYRASGVERLLRDAHGAQFHPLPEVRQRLFTGRVAMGLDPITGDA
jgi:alkylation response protein AidB-like acyl-CoA dehydrogenase